MAWWREKLFCYHLLREMNNWKKNTKIKWAQNERGAFRKLLEQIYRNNVWLEIKWKVSQWMMSDFFLSFRNGEKFRDEKYFLFFFCVCVLQKSTLLVEKILLEIIKFHLNKLKMDLQHSIFDIVENRKKYRSALVVCHPANSCHVIIFDFLILQHTRKRWENYSHYFAPFNSIESGRKEWRRMKSVKRVPKNKGKWK
jgi:hypothetical protein